MAFLGRWCDLRPPDGQFTSSRMKSQKRAFWWVHLPSHVIFLAAWVLLAALQEPIGTIKAKVDVFACCVLFSVLHFATILVDFLILSRLRNLAVINDDEGTRTQGVLDAVERRSKTMWWKDSYTDFFCASNIRIVLVWGSSTRRHNGGRTS